MGKAPPKWPLRFFRWFCRPDYQEDIEGDLNEHFNQIMIEQGEKWARWRFFLEVLFLFRPGIIRNFQLDQFLITRSMFKHHLLISYRGFLRHKASFFINLFGLAIGMACFFAIYLWVQDEWNVDRFHKKNKELVQVLSNWEHPDRIDTDPGTPVLLGSTFQEEHPEVLMATHFSRYWQQGTIRKEGQTIRMRPCFADSSFFRVFSFDLIQGSADHSLNAKNKVVLSVSLAEKVFPNEENYIGKEIQYEHENFRGVFQVSGVFSKIKKKSTLNFDLLFPLENYLDQDAESLEWYTNTGSTYLVLRKGTNRQAYNEKIADYLKPKTKWRENCTLFIQGYADRYLHGNYENGKIVGGRIIYVRLFSIIALFILIIACINFMNLSTAQASRKMKEIGVKKTFGAPRSLLVQQFLTEAFLLSFIAFFLAALLVYIFLPSFNQITGKSIELQLSLGQVLSILGIVVMTALLAGSYPAWYLSRFQPTEVFYRKSKMAFGQQWARQGLVVFQFVLSVIFIVGVIVVNQQMQYIQNKNLGYNRDQIIHFQRPTFRDNPRVFLEELGKIPGVKEVGNLAGSFMDADDLQKGYNWRGNAEDEAYVFKAPMIGYNIIETLGMEIVEGRSFSREYRDNPSKIIINESAKQLMGLEEPIGAILDKDVGYGREQRQIIGVVKDFNYGSIHEPIKPLILRFRGRGRQILLKLNANSGKETLAAIEQVYKDHYPEATFAFTFLDEQYQALYESEARVAVLSKYFSLLAIFISCLGLLGLAIFTTEKRTKEIGIRKTLGAGVWKIVQLLSKDFAKLVLIAILIAIPISYLITAKWLENFAYKISIQAWYFVLAASITFVLACLTVGLQTIRAANLNPVDCLNRE